MPDKAGYSWLMPSKLCEPPGGDSEDFNCVQGAGHEQLVDDSQIGWQQGEVSSIILVSRSLGSVLVCSFQLGGGLLPVKIT